jgi:hypothetical protein
VQTAASRQMEQSASPSPTVASLLVWTTGGSGCLTATAGAPDQPGKRVGDRMPQSTKRVGETRPRPETPARIPLGPVVGGLALSLVFVGWVLDER